MLSRSQHWHCWPFRCLWYHRPHYRLEKTWWLVWGYREGTPLVWIISDPQGSALGHLLFTLYSTPLSSMISGHALPHHLYANDSQLYVSPASGDSAAALNGLQSCLASVQSWMSTDKLKLNTDKTEFIVSGNERQRSKHRSMFPIKLFFSVSKLTLLNLRGILE